MTAISTPDSLTLVEHTTLEEVWLTPDQARRLAHFRFKSSDSATDKDKEVRILEVSPGRKPGTYNLRPNSIVGSFSAAGLRVNIRPKIGVGMTVQMLAYSLGLARILNDDGAFDRSSSFTALIAPSYVRAVREIVHQGIVEDYVVVTTRGAQPRGSIDLQVIARQGLPIPIDYTYDEFTPDNSLNRLLVRGLHAILDLATPDFAVHTEARALLTGFAGVQFELNPNLYRGDELPSRVAHYQDALVLATMILEGVGLEPLAADRRARGLLFDMNRVFEDFVTAVATRTAARGISVDAQGTDHPRFLDSERRFRIKPDLAAWSGSDCLLVGDVKYKLLDDSHAIRRPDLYQMSAYAATLETTEAVLLYVGTGADDEIHIEQPPVRVRASPVDLDQGIEAAEMRIAEILWAPGTGLAQANIA